MKVIMLETVRKVGVKDEIIEVSDGYANNYLIKNKLAVPYTKRSKEVLDVQVKTRAKEEELRVEEYKKIQAKLDNKTISFKVKTGEQERVFGKVSTKQIADELKNKGFNIDKKCINLTSDIDVLGMHEVVITLHKKVSFKINVNLVK